VVGKEEGGIRLKLDKDPKAKRGKIKGPCADRPLDEQLKGGSSPQEKRGKRRTNVCSVEKRKVES